MQCRPPANRRRLANGLNTTVKDKLALRKSEHYETNE